MNYRGNVLATTPTPAEKDASFLNIAESVAFKIPAKSFFASLDADERVEVALVALDEKDASRTVIAKCDIGLKEASPKVNSAEIGSVWYLKRPDDDTAETKEDEHVRMKAVIEFYGLNRGAFSANDLLNVNINQEKEDSDWDMDEDEEAAPLRLELDEKRDLFVVGRPTHIFYFKFGINAVHGMNELSASTSSILNFKVHFLGAELETNALNDHAYAPEEFSATLASNDDDIRRFFSRFIQDVHVDLVRDASDVLSTTTIRVRENAHIGDVFKNRATFPNVDGAYFDYTLEIERVKEFLWTEETSMTGQHEEEKTQFEALKNVSEDLERWKEEEKRKFRERLKDTEETHSEFVSAEWRIREQQREKDVQEKLAEMDRLSDALKIAMERLHDREAAVEKREKRVQHVNNNNVTKKWFEEEMERRKQETSSLLKQMAEDKREFASKLKEAEKNLKRIRDLEKQLQVAEMNLQAAEIKLQTAKEDEAKAQNAAEKFRKAWTDSEEELRGLKWERQQNQEQKISQLQKENRDLRMKLQSREKRRDEDDDAKNRELNALKERRSKILETGIYKPDDAILKDIEGKIEALESRD